MVKESHINNVSFSKFPLKEQQGPEHGTADILEQMSSKDMATELTNYDWELFTAMHEVPIRHADLPHLMALWTSTIPVPAKVGSVPPRLQVELIYYVFGRHKFPGAITANLERFVRRFNEVQHWVVTELCLCEDLVKRAVLLKKFIKIAAV